MSQRVQSGLVSIVMCYLVHLLFSPSTRDQVGGVDFPWKTNEEGEGARVGESPDLFDKLLEGLQWRL